MQWWTSHCRAERTWCLHVLILLVCFRLGPLLVGSSFWWSQLLVWCWQKDLGIQTSLFWSSVSSSLWLATSQAFCWHFLPTNLGRGTVKLSVHFFLRGQSKHTATGRLCCLAMSGDIKNLDLEGGWNKMPHHQEWKNHGTSCVNESKGQSDGKL